jgi:hypothetical protein
MNAPAAFAAWRAMTSSVLDRPVADPRVHLTAAIAESRANSSGQGYSDHLVMFEKMLACECDEFLIAGVVNDFIAGDVGRCLWPVLFCEMPKIGQPHVTSCDQYLRDAIQRIAGLIEELVFGPYRAAVLARDVQMGVHQTFLQLACTELQHSRCLVIDQDHGVK